MPCHNQVMGMTDKERVRDIYGRDTKAQTRFIATLLEVAAGQATSSPVANPITDRTALNSSCLLETDSQQSRQYIENSI